MTTHSDRGDTSPKGKAPEKEKLTSVSNQENNTEKIKKANISLNLREPYAVTTSDDDGDKEPGPHERMRKVREFSSITLMEKKFFDQTVQEFNENMEKKCELLDAKTMIGFIAHEHEIRSRYENAHNRALGIYENIAKTLCQGQEMKTEWQTVLKAMYYHGIAVHDELHQDLKQLAGEFNAAVEQATDPLDKLVVREKGNWIDNILEQMNYMKQQFSKNDGEFVKKLRRIAFYLFDEKTNKLFKRSYYSIIGKFKLSLKEAQGHFQDLNKMLTSKAKIASGDLSAIRENVSTIYQSVKICLSKIKDLEQLNITIRNSDPTARGSDSVGVSEAA